MGRFYLTVGDVYFSRYTFKIKHADFYMEFGVGYSKLRKAARIAAKKSLRKAKEAQKVRSNI